MPKSKDMAPKKVNRQATKTKQTEKKKLRYQSFTSLMANLRQDINRVSSFRRYLNGPFPGRNCSVMKIGT